MNVSATYFKKTKVILALFVFLILVFCLIAGVNYYNKNEMPAADPSRYLYRITKENKTLYLLGTIRYGAKPPILNDTLKKAYLESDIVVTEIRADRYMEEFDLDTYKLNPISQIDSPSLADQFEKINKKYKLVTDDAKQYSASYIQARVSEEALTSLRMKSDYGVDVFLYNMALRDKKKIGELETIKEREGMTAVTDQNCPHYLLHGLEHKNAIKENLSQSLKYYADGTVQQHFIDNPFASLRDTQVGEEAQAYLDVVLYGRNDIMYERMIPFMQDEIPLVLVGIDHLLSEQGLLKRFEQDGYQINCLYNDH